MDKSVFNMFPAKALLRATVFPALFFCCSGKESSPPAPAPVKTIAYDWTKFSMGADLSYAAQMQDQGVVYYDSGQVRDVFTLFKNHGCNTVRIRIWHNPAAYGSGGDQLYNDLAHVKTLIRKARQAGMAINLDLHYSDTWADPGKQYTPAAWSTTDPASLKDSVYRYTSDLLNNLKTDNLVPEMIQVGNENNSGILWPLGKTNNNDFTAFSQLLNSGIRAVRDFSAGSSIKPRIILHVAQLQNADWWTGNLIAAGTTDFDILGISHYPDYSTVNNMGDITTTIRQLVTKYNKQVMIVETAYWWNGTDAKGNAVNKTPLTGYPFTPAMQYQYLKDLAQAVISGGGSGVQYWAPDYRNSNWGGEMTARSLFDYNGNLLEGIDFMRYGYRF